MHCVFPTCDHDNRRTYSQGISFFSFPEEASLRMAWLKALGKENFDPGADCAVCSSHFLTEDFLETRGGCKLRSDAVPVVHLEVCRICFARNCKLYPIKNYMHLDKAYENLTGFMMQEQDAKLPPYLCIQCSNRLLNAVRFKAKSIRAHTILLEIIEDYGYITLDTIMSISRLQSPFTSDLTQNNIDTEHMESEKSFTDEESGKILHHDVKSEADDVNDNILITNIKYDYDTECLASVRRDSSDCEVELENAIKEEANDVIVVNDQESPCSQDEGTGVHDERDTCRLAGNRGDSQSIDNDMNQSDNLIDEDCSLNDTLTSGEATRYVQLSSTREVSTEIKDLNQSKVKTCSKSKGNGGLLLSYRLISCDICPYQTVSKVQLTHHLKDHVNKKIYNCNKCDFITKSKKRLKFHMDIHNDEKRYLCDICDKKFCYKVDLKAHLRIHSGEKPYSCDICKKKFNQHNQLKAHMRIHSGEKPYPCNVCNKAFRQKGQLQNHLLIHSGEKPYLCDVCTKAFVQRGQLQNHLRIHSGEKPYSCEVCNKAFVQKGQLQNHLRIHSGVKSYSCHVCTKAFTQRLQLQNHLLTHSM